jgi:hypothetical protein
MELQELIIETPMCEMYRSGQFVCEINEYTFRNIQIAVKEGKVNNDFNFINKAGESTKLADDGWMLNGKFAKGFSDLTYILTFKLTD